ncbi:MAG: hypothetical protein J7K33_01825 [Candidatus Marinimicrobia bacterium]|nr:hypothetical protein [Candidatus Neomarinimicrobiota bacterium]
MLCLAISKDSIRHARIEDENFSWQNIKYIEKTSLPFELSPCNIETMISQFGNIFESIIPEERIVDEEVLLSLPVEMGSYKIYPIEEKVDEEILPQYLEFCEEKRLGKRYKDSLVQFYPLEENRFLAISFPKRLISSIAETISKTGLKLRLVDINFISSLYGVEKIYNTTSLSSWALSLVCDAFQMVALMKGSNIISLTSFTLMEGGSYKILSKSNHNEEMVSLIEELDRVRFSPTDKLRTVEKFYVYSYDTYSDYFNIFLTYRVDNIEVVDPFIKFKPLRLYKGDGDGAGAMSQFTDVVGLLYRFYYGEL